MRPPLLGYCCPAWQHCTLSSHCWHPLLHACFAPEHITTIMTAMFHIQRHTCAQRTHWLPPSHCLSEMLVLRPRASGVQAADLRRPAAGRHHRLLGRPDQRPGARTQSLLWVAAVIMSMSRVNGRVSKPPGPTFIHAMSAAPLRLALAAHLTSCTVQAADQDALYPALYAYISNATADSQVWCCRSLCF